MPVVVCGVEGLDGLVPGVTRQLTQAFKQTGGRERQIVAQQMAFLHDERARLTVEIIVCCMAIQPKAEFFGEALRASTKAGLRRRKHGGWVVIKDRERAAPKVCRILSQGFVERD